MTLSNPLQKCESDTQSRWQCPSGNNVVDGLSYGVMKAEEFSFRSKLTHPQATLKHPARHSISHIPDDSYASHAPPPFDSHSTYSAPCSAVGGLNSIASTENAVNCRSRAYSLPAQPLVSAPRLDFFFSASSNNNYHGVSSFSVSTPPGVYAPLKETAGGDSFSHMVCQQDVDHSMRIYSNLHTIKEEPHVAASQNPLLYQQPQQNTFHHIQNQQYQSALRSHAGFVQQQKANFVSGDPHSDRLAEFVSKMVFVIFWQGSESFSSACKSGNNNPIYNIQHIPELSTANSCFPSTDFMCYTKYLLETMQVSCSTALLSLFYLHRLRPCVKQLFVPGTFVDNNASNNNQYLNTSSKHQQQYRRDPKLEYRLFTVALILANKYLDDNSYSNKAWSEITGLDLRKINVMELEFMRYVDYSLLVKEREYVAWVRWLEAFIRVVMDPPSTRYLNNTQSPELSYLNSSPHMRDFQRYSPTMNDPACAMYSSSSPEYPLYSHDINSRMLDHNKYAAHGVQMIPKFPTSSVTNRFSAPSNLPTPKSIRKVDRISSSSSINGSVDIGSSSVSSSMRMSIPSGTPSSGASSNIPYNRRASRASVSSASSDCEDMMPIPNSSYQQNCNPFLLSPSRSLNYQNRQQQYAPVASMQTYKQPKLKLPRRMSCPVYNQPPQLPQQPGTRYCNYPPPRNYNN